MPDLPFHIDPTALADFCRANHIRRLAVFGSALRSDYRPESDVDILVEFEPCRVPGFGFFRIQEELSVLIGREVDLETEGFLSPHFRSQVLNEALTLYEAA
ncbi:MAG: nucleotidyltransferase family protein [Actinobacteria bacterium]|nr:nucleotidyltransferase family protein [Actinomycetota bacterium]